MRTQDFSLTAELRLEADTDAAAILSQANLVRAHVDAVQITDSPGGRTHLCALAASAILLDNDIDPVMHLTCRDRNRMALRSDLLGAAALGVTSLLVRRGEKIPRDAKSQVKTVYDWGVKRLIAEARSMQSESPFARPVDFLVGTAATAFKPDRDWTPEKVTGKAKAGANFIQTQLCFDVDLLRHYVARLVSRQMVEQLDVIVSLAPLPSADVASWLGKNLRGAVVPARVVKRLRQATDPEEEGVAICAELLRDCADVPGVSGANLISLGILDSVLEAISTSGVRLN